MGSVKIGNQIWMKDNLSVDKFLNGDVIPQANSDLDWEQKGKNGIPAWCYHPSNSNNQNKLGKLYNFWAVVDKRGLAPKGWHIPSNAEWIKLVDEVGGVGKANYVLKSKTEWIVSGNGSDGFGWNGRPGGTRHYNGLFSVAEGFSTDWCTSTESNLDLTSAYFWGLVYAAGEVGRGVKNKGSGIYVRCIRD